MIEESCLNYVEEFILKSGEELDWDSASQEHLLMEVKIIKRSARTFRVAGFLILSDRPHLSQETSIPSELEALALTARRRIHLDDQDRQAFIWLEEGWLMKEVRFEKDEKTVRSSHYRMGFRLYQYEQIKSHQKSDQIRNEFLDIKGQILSTLSTQVKDRHVDFHPRDIGIQHIVNVTHQLHVDDLGSSNYFPKKWPLAKRLKFLHFLNAFSHICIEKDEFDWKEIGANYFQKIGGSKEFDANKQEFIGLLEEWADVQVIELGITSLGQITPIFFAGQLRGNYASYEWGPVHALTNLSIINEAYRTNATTLWLVENRAILTRIAAAGHFLRETHSIIVCVDGHVRSAHRKAISQILANSSIKQVMIWCDYDPDGLQISKEIYAAVKQHNELSIKWILPDQQMMNDFNQYEQEVLHFLEHSHMEQEQMMGGVELWRKWILD